MALKLLKSWTPTSRAAASRMVSTSSSLMKGGKYKHFSSVHFLCALRTNVLTEVLQLDLKKTCPSRQVLQVMQLDVVHASSLMHFQAPTMSQLSKLNTLLDDLYN